MLLKFDESIKPSRFQLLDPGLRVFPDGIGSGLDDVRTFFLSAAALFFFRFLSLFLPEIFVVFIQFPAADQLIEL